MRGRWLAAALALGLGGHLLGWARSPLPAQDGLDFLSVAERGPWDDPIGLIRGTDRPPLYPALVALAHRGLGLGALWERAGAVDGWAWTARVVSLAFWGAALLGVYGAGRAMFGSRAGRWGVLCALTVPALGEVGHDALSDSAGAAFWALGLWAVLARGWSSMVPAGMLAGLLAGAGFWARTETGLLGLIGALALLGRRDFGLGSRLVGAAGCALAAGALIGGYGLMRGTVSEKLAARGWIPGEGVEGVAVRRELSTSLEHPFHLRIDAKPAERDARGGSGARAAAGLVGDRLVGGIGWACAGLGVLGLWTAPRRVSRWSAGVFALAYLGAMGLHAERSGYLSARHAIPMALALAPWAGYGARRAWRWARGARGGGAVRWGAAVLFGALATVPAARATHEARWGHWAAGVWMARDAAERGWGGRGEAAALDTRGWAGRVSGLEVYDCWHARQALSDARLRYVVLEAGELGEDSERGRILRELLDRAGERASGFPKRAGGKGEDVLVFRFDRGRLIGAGVGNFGEGGR